MKMSDADAMVRKGSSPYRCLSDLGFPVAPSTDEVSSLNNDNLFTNISTGKPMKTGII